MFLNMKGTHITVTVEQDSTELTAKGEVLNLSYFLLHEEKLKKKLILLFSIICYKLMVYLCSTLCYKIKCIRISLLSCLPYKHTLIVFSFKVPMTIIFFFAEVFSLSYVQTNSDKFQITSNSVFWALKCSYFVLKVSRGLVTN